MLLRYCGLISASLLLTAGLCEGGDSDQLGNHNCVAEYGSDFAALEYFIEHDIGWKCPVSISQQGQRLGLSGTVVDRGFRDGGKSGLAVYDHQGILLDDDFQLFQWDVNGRWVALHYVEFPANTGGGADLLYYVPDASYAKVWLEYNQFFHTSIAGTATPEIYTRQVWTADPTGGTAPYSYRWYREWDLVGSESSYSAFIDSPADFQIRLEMIDANGRKTADYIYVYPSDPSCPDCL